MKPIRQLVGRHPLLKEVAPQVRQIRHRGRPFCIGRLDPGADEIALVSAVGRKMSSRPGISGRLFKALGDAGVNIRTIAQGADELAITVGVDNKDFETAIRVLYDGFAG